jgi:hypothetical protein
METIKAGLFQVDIDHKRLEVSITLLPEAAAAEGGENLADYIRDRQGAGYQVYHRQPVRFIQFRDLID